MRRQDGSQIACRHSLQRLCAAAIHATMDREERSRMIRLFRHDGLEIMLNIDMIKDIQYGQPTVLTLFSGEKLQVKNTQTDVLTKIRACRKGREDEEREFAPAANRKSPGVNQ
jgi:uncharacterized protein YlzI (FlbEa/FlbD family)